MKRTIDYLRHVDLYIRGLRIYNKDSSEYQRLTTIVRPDVYSKMTPEEIEEYERGDVMSEEEVEKIRLEDLARMELNKDSNSI